MIPDLIDEQILKILVRDAKSPLARISASVNLSVPAVSERIRKLEAAGYIGGYTLVLDPLRFGKSLTCYTFVSLRYDEAELEKFWTFVQAEADILECHLVTGDHEYMLKIVTEDSNRLGEILGELRKQAEVVTSSTSISLSTLKQSRTTDPVFRDPRHM